MTSSFRWRHKIRTSVRRFARARYIRFIFVAFLLYAILDFVSLSWTFSKQTLPSPSEAPPNLPKIFVSSTHWNNEPQLRGFWNRAVLDLAEHVGQENIYISIYESGSWDDSKGALRQLDQELQRMGVQRTIVLDNTTHEDALAKFPIDSLGWVDTPGGQKKLRRVPYLANLRNLSLKPMIDLALNGIRFDKVLFLNDVAFMAEDVVTLLRTREGRYAAACSMDFQNPPQFYDTFALRDSKGHEAATSTFPYFRSRLSRNALIAGQPVPVQSCWNGIVAFDAFPFYKSMEQLKFRGIPDSLANYHLEGSECCLIHADNSYTILHGVWVNPEVRVGYNMNAYKTVHQGTMWPSAITRIKGIWINRVRRWSTFTFHKSWTVQSRVQDWEKKGSDRREPGKSCLINEMQVLVPNGWAHV